MADGYTETSPFRIGDLVQADDGFAGLVDGARCEQGEWFYDVYVPGRRSTYSEMELTRVAN